MTDQTKNRMMILPGDTINCKGLSVVVGSIQSQSNYGTADEPCFYIEFKDENGIARYWKQDVDGGSVVFDNDRLIVLCDVCGYCFEVDNEDDYVAALCPICYSDPFDGDLFYVGDGEVSDQRSARICGCEDYPCCGH